jgi:hypothetical protein
MSNATSFGAGGGLGDALSAVAVLGESPTSDASGFKFGLVALFVGMCTRSVLRIVPAGWYRPPYTVVMFIAGCLLEYGDPDWCTKSMETWKHL